MSTEKKLTAMQELINDLKCCKSSNSFIQNTTDLIIELAESKLEKEKQQIIDAYQNAESEMSKRFSSDMHKWVGAGQYYGKTFKNE